MTHYTTNNPVRDEHIEAAIAVVRRHGLDVTVATMTDCLPEGFELDAAELSGILSNEAPPAEPEPVEPRPGRLVHRGGSGRGERGRSVRVPSQLVPR